ncbi:hypothetical protein ACC668_26910 [Rhizobium ruizarguesonis]|jgi:hypothetical protein
MDAATQGSRFNGMLFNSDAVFKTSWATDGNHKNLHGEPLLLVHGKTITDWGGEKAWERNSGYD